MGKTWKLRVFDKKKYEKTHGKDSVAITYSYKRTIDMQPTGVRKETIIHELVHAYLGEMCLKSTEKIKADDMEEICADLFAKRGRELLNLADVLMDEINVNSAPAAVQMPTELESIVHFTDDNGDSPCGDKKENSVVTDDYAQVTCDDCKFKAKQNLT